MKYKSCKKARNYSGFGWDPLAKKVLNPNEDDWARLIKVCAHFSLFVSYFDGNTSDSQSDKSLACWQHEGFPLYDEMAYLVDGTYATGDGAFRAGEPEISLDDEVTTNLLDDENDSELEEVCLHSALTM